MQQRPFLVQNLVDNTAYTLESIKVKAQAPGLPITVEMETSFPEWTLK